MYIHSQTDRQTDRDKENSEKNTHTYAQSHALLCTMYTSSVCPMERDNKNFPCLLIHSALGHALQEERVGEEGLLEGKQYLLKLLTYCNMGHAQRCAYSDTYCNTQNLSRCTHAAQPHTELSCHSQPGVTPS